MSGKASVLQQRAPMTVLTWTYILPTPPTPYERSQGCPAPRTTALVGPPEAQLLLCPVLVGASPSVPLKPALSPEEKSSCPLHNLVTLTAQPLDRRTGGPFNVLKAHSNPEFSGRVSKIMKNTQFLLRL